MNLEMIDVFAIYLYGLTWLVGVTAVLILIFGLDDLFMDLCYWGRRLRRRLTIYRRHTRFSTEDLHYNQEKPIAIMLPAWQESGVIRSMIDQAIENMDYENYQVFVGTYPNDEKTQNAVDEATAIYSNVHKVVCARPGPTSKADCLNNILAAIQDFERSTRVEFAGFVLHDAEDLVSEYELRIFNALLERKDLIQLPVYPLVRPWFHFTSGHYLDEFTEQHGKEVILRESFSGVVPSAGVGTCFSRRAILELMRINDGVAFDVRSLTEDYLIGIRLWEAGMTGAFVHWPIMDHRGRKAMPMVGVSEYFPDTFTAAVRQKSRWIMGIIYQGWSSIRRNKGFWFNYFLWRDRRGALSHFVAFVAVLLFVQALLLIAYEAIVTESYQFLSMFARYEWIYYLLLINLALILNRLAHRFYFVARAYGILQGVLSMPRMIWSNVINFVANLRAIRVFAASKNRKRLQWDKTEHDYPHLGGATRVPLAQILMDRGDLDKDGLVHSLLERRFGERLGRTLLRLGLVEPEALAAALAQQAGLEWESVDPETLNEALIAKLPRRWATRYGVVPIREEGQLLVVAAEGPLPPVARNALQRRIGRPIQVVVAPAGTVTYALRRWYTPTGEHQDVTEILKRLQETGELQSEQAREIWRSYLSRQRILGDVLIEERFLESSALHQALLDYDSSDQSFGRFLVDAGYITVKTLEDALNRQKVDQPTIEQVLGEHGIRLADAPGTRP